MYCVKCGVRLQDGVEICPLCETPVWNPESAERDIAYPERLPDKYRESGLRLDLLNGKSVTFRFKGKADVTGLASAIRKIIRI